MRKFATWTLRIGFAVLATCGFATCQHDVPGPRITPHREARPVAPRPKPTPAVGILDMAEPAAVSPRKPPLDAGVDGGGAPLPPIPDGGPARADAGIPLTSQALPATP